MEILPRLLAAYPDRVRLCRVVSGNGRVEVVAAAKLDELLDGNRFLSQHKGRSPQLLWLLKMRRFLVRTLADWFRHGSGGENKLLQQVMQQGDTLLVIGGGWSQPNLTAAVRQLKRRCGVKFALMVHDIVPLSCPQFAKPNGISRFRGWLEGMAELWDQVLTPSTSAMTDLTEYLESTGRTAPPVTRVQFGSGFTQSGDSVADPIETEPYVLYVSTIEVRKNHILLFRIWKRLIEARGADAVPLLVFAGRWGWEIRELRDALRATHNLGGKISIVSDLTDAELGRAYKDCLFTVFPSFYEGWGLPISESLVYGKLCVASCASSIPEVGCGFIDTFDPEDEESAYQLVEQALNKDYRTVKEDWIKQNYRPVEWHVTADAIVRALDGPLEHDHSAVG